jgi:hypothetical protein
VPPRTKRPPRITKQRTRLNRLDSPELLFRMCCFGTLPRPRKFVQPNPAPPLGCGLSQYQYCYHSKYSPALDTTRIFGDGMPSNLQKIEVFCVRRQSFASLLTPHLLKTVQYALKEYVNHARCVAYRRGAPPTQHWSTMDLEKQLLLLHDDLVGVWLGASGCCLGD